MNSALKSGLARKNTEHPALAKSTQNPVKISQKWRKLAETRCAELGERLTPARLAAYAELLACNRPVTAYELIALMERTQNRKIAPLTAYRHLDFLIRVGLVHRLESTQSYLPCDHPEHDHESQYFVCSTCGHVEEVESKPLEKLLHKIAGEFEFQPHNAVVEVKGLCGSCVAESSD